MKLFKIIRGEIKQRFKAISQIIAFLILSLIIFFGLAALCIKLIGSSGVQILGINLVGSIILILVTSVFVFLFVSFLSTYASFVVELKIKSFNEQFTLSNFIKCIFKNKITFNFKKYLMALANCLFFFGLVVLLSYAAISIINIFAKFETIDQCYEKYGDYAYTFSTFVLPIICFVQVNKSYIRYFVPIFSDGKIMVSFFENKELKTIVRRSDYYRELTPLFIEYVILHTVVYGGIFILLHFGLKTPILSEYEILFSCFGSVLVYVLMSPKIIIFLEFLMASKMNNILFDLMKNRIDNNNLVIEAYNELDPKLQEVLGDDDPKIENAKKENEFLEQIILEIAKNKGSKKTNLDEIIDDLENSDSDDINEFINNLDVIDDEDDDDEADEDDNSE